MNPRGKQASNASKDPKAKAFNLSTYKWHALGDYANTIRRYGTTDNYSTQTVSRLKNPIMYQPQSFTGRARALLGEEVL
jgi:hypothetical protein